MAADHAVFDIKGAVEDIESAVIMGDDDDPRVVFVGDAGEEFHDLPTPFAVERGSRLVGKDQAGFVGKGAGDGDTLLFSAGECIREIVGTRADSQLV